MSNNSANRSHVRGAALPPPRQKDLPPIPWHTRLVSKVKHTPKRLVHWWWTWELLASALSIIATVALIAVLRQADGNAQQSWMIGNTELTLNTIVAGISTVIRAALLVAVAGALNQSLWNRFSSPRKGGSRPARPLKDLDIFGGAASDSWGSLRLLWRTKGFASDLAAVGAALTILTLAFDVFTQQVLAITARNIVEHSAKGMVNNETLLPRALNYTGAFLPSDIGNFAPETQFSTISGIVSSILNISVPLIEPTCPTGNCTWPRTPTIAICSACTNLTLSSTIPYDGSVTYSALWDDVADVGDQKVSLTFEETISTTYPNVSLLVSTGSRPVLDNRRLRVVDIYAFGISPSNEGIYNEMVGPDEPLSTKLLDPLMTAYNCKLNFCLQTFNASTTAGKFRQELIGYWDEMKANGDGPDDSWSFTEPSGVSNIRNVSGYFVDTPSLKALGQAFESVISGRVLIDQAQGTLRFVAVDGTSNDYANQNGFAQAFYNASDSLHQMSALSQQIADGMTTWLRTTRQAPAEAEYAPTVFITDIIVIVRWPWLAYPLGLLVTAQIFVVATILQTRRRRVRPWKSHRLPLLLANIDDNVKEIAVGGLETRNGLEDRVGRMTVRLDFDEQDEILFRRVP